MDWGRPRYLPHPPPILRTFTRETSPHFRTISRLSTRACSIALPIPSRAPIHAVGVLHSAGSIRHTRIGGPLSFPSRTSTAAVGHDVRYAPHHMSGPP